MKEIHSNLTGATPMLILNSTQSPTRTYTYNSEKECSFTYKGLLYISVISSRIK
uniref:Uncharacterized protein n=1 Tax=Lepeophtheirus salmonis TaxID=72036 RepID=A0A0K2U1N8_LEPSM